VSKRVTARFSWVLPSMNGCHNLASIADNSAKLSPLFCSV